MRYFVTGATGFIGGRLAARLLAAGHEVVALVRSPERAAGLRELGARLAPGDITDRASLRAPMRGVDAVCHVAAWYKVGARDRSMAERVNVEGTRNVLELMRELGIGRGVYTSTLAVHSDTRGRLVDETYRFDGEHLSEYDRTKWRAHYEVALPLARAGLPLVIVQPGVVYGPGDASAMGETLRQYLRGKLPMVPRGTTFCWSHVDDVVTGHLLALDKGVPGETYILAGPPHSLVDVFALAERITGVRAPRLRVAPAVLRGMSAVMGVVGALAPLPEAYSAEALRVVAGVTYTGSNAKARRELGYAPRELEVGLRETLEHELAVSARG